MVIIMENMETQNITENLKQAKKQFSKIGLMAFVGSLIIMGLQLGTAGIVKLIDESILDNMNVYFALNMLPMYLVGMPILIFLLTRVKGKKIEKHKMNVGHWFLAFFMCYALLYVSNLIGQFITTIVGLFKGNMIENPILEATTGVNPWLSAFFIVICAPILEEIIFRKVLIERSVKYGEGVAVFLSAFMFGMYHGNVNQLIYAFVLGLMFGFIYVKTGKLIYTIILHMVINFMGSVAGLFVLNLLDMEAYEQMMTMTDPAEMTAALLKIMPGLMALMGYLAVILCIVITGIILLVVMRKKFVCKQGEVIIPKGKRFSTMMLNVGMILFIILWTIMIIYQLFV